MKEKRIGELEKLRMEIMAEIAGASVEAEEDIYLILN